VKANRKKSSAAGRTALVELPAYGVVATEPDRVIYIRLPPPGHLEKFSQLSRAKLNELVLQSNWPGREPPVKSIVVPNKRGNKKGCRLIILDSLLSFLRSLENHPQRAA
jgi:hypothetical protein